MKPATLLVLAAGLGSRYGGLKQVETVGPNGETIIDYSVHDAVRAGFGKVVFLIRREIADTFRSSVGSRFEELVPVEYAFQDLDDLPASHPVPADRVKPWGTGQAIWAARRRIDGPFAVINADDFYGRTAYELLGRHLAPLRDSKCADYAMVAYVLRNTLSEHGGVSRGICDRDRQGFLSRVVEHVGIVPDGENARLGGVDGPGARIPGDKLVSMNFWGFTPAIFAQLEGGLRDFVRKRGDEPESEFYIPTLVGELVGRGEARVTVLESPDTWFGITHPLDRARVAEHVKGLNDDGKYPAKLFT